MVNDDPPRTRCPLVHVAEITPSSAEEFEPLLEWLRGGHATDTELPFARGTVCADGRLDLCKQDVGVANTKRLLHALEHNDHVRHVLLGTDGLGDEGAALLASHIERDDTLETVYLGCNVIREEGARALGEAISGSETVRALWLKRNPLGVGGARALAVMLERNTHLRTLDLTNTELGDDGFAELARGLARHPSLECLYVGGNGLGVSSMEVLGEALERAPKLTELYLDTNPIGDDGARVIASWISDAGVRILGLASSAIGTDGVRALAASDLRGVRRLDLGYTLSARPLEQAPNAFGDVGVEHLAHWLATDPALRHLDLRRSGITSRGALAIERAMGTNHHMTRVLLGAGIASKVRKRINARCAHNQKTWPELDVPVDVLRIRSVYRSFTS